MEVEITNYVEFKVFRVTDFANEFFPHSTSFFINDLEGTCYGIESLGIEGLLPKYFELAWEPKIPKIVGDPIKATCLHHGKNMVLAAGTGLGTALITPESRTSQNHTVLALEGGHIAVTASTLDDKEGIEERELLAYLSKKLYDGEHAIEYEDVVSGRGVVNVYGFFAQKFNLPPADSITAVIDALKETTAAKDASLGAFKSFFRFLIRCAQTLTVATQSKCVFLAGDNQVANAALVRNLSDLLKTDWEWHTKPQWVQPVFVWTQNQKYNFNLKGALFAASKVK
jgi:glucokinase